VELIVGEISARCFPGIVESWCSVERTLRIYGEDPVINDVAVPRMETVEGLGVPFFLRKLICEAERVADLKKPLIIEHGVVFILGACPG